MRASIAVWLSIPRQSGGGQDGAWSDAHTKRRFWASNGASELIPQFITSAIANRVPNCHPYCSHFGGYFYKIMAGQNHENREEGLAARERPPSSEALWRTKWRTGGPGRKTLPFVYRFVTWLQRRMMFRESRRFLNPTQVQAVRYLFKKRGLTPGRMP